MRLFLQRLTLPSVVGLSSSSSSWATFYFLLASSSIICFAQGQQQLFFLPDHPYVAPGIDSIDPELGPGISRQRGPCPGLNTLANHGYIHRNGTDIPFDDLVSAAEEVFGIDRDSAMAALTTLLIEGNFVAKLDKETGRFSMNLFDLYQVDRHASMFRQDGRFAEMDPSLLDRFVKTYATDEGKSNLTKEDVLQFRLERIRESRQAHAYEHEDWFLHDLPPKGLAENMAFDMMALLSMGQDPYLDSISPDLLTIFLLENRIPNIYLPRKDRGLGLVSFTDNQLNSLFVPPLEEEVLKDVHSYLDDDDTSNITNIVISISVTVVALASVAGLLMCYKFKNSKPTTQQVDNNQHHKTDVHHQESANTLEEENKSDDDMQMIAWMDNHDHDIESKTLTWENLSLEAQKKRNWFSSSKTEQTTKHTILSKVSGTAPGGQLTCILGPSGSGKTSLLNILGGRHRFSRGTSSVKLTGKIRINGTDVSPESLLLQNQEHRIGFVGQEDSILESATPREAIRFSARLRLPRHVKEEQIAALTKEILSDLQLTTVQDRSSSLLSGGEKRRVSLGVELVTRPQLLLLDEVTSGLDSFSASLVVEVCLQIAKKRKAAVVMVIHQPNSSIFSMMNRVILMNSGECMYEGTAGEMAEYFSERGLGVPQDYSIPDWVLNVAQSEPVVTLKEKGFFQRDGGTGNGPSFILSRSRSILSSSRSIIQDGGSFRNHLEGGNQVGQPQRKDPPLRASMRTEIVELILREIIGIQRDPWPLLGRFGMLFALALLVGVCYFQVADDSLEDPSSFSSHVGVVFLLVFAGSIVLILNVTEAAETRARFCREYATGHYRLASYAIALALFDFVITFVDVLLFLSTSFYTIGLTGRFWYWLCVGLVYALVASATGHLLAAIPDNAALAHEQVPLAVTPQLLLSGFLVAYDALPRAIRWFVWLQPLTYAFRLALNEEFSECMHMSPDEELLLDCAKALEATLATFGHSGLTTIYGDESVLTLAPAGRYYGTKNIIEYLSYFSVEQNEFSVFWDYCPLEGHQQIAINEVGEGFCDITTSTVSSARVNGKFDFRPTEEEPKYLQFVMGRRLQLQYNPEAVTDGATIARDDVFFPQEGINYALRNIKSSSMAAVVCSVQEHFCPDVFTYNGYQDSVDCVRQMELELPHATTNDAGMETVDGNSTACRHLHASLAVLDPDAHCPHLSFLPMKDKDGKIKCTGNGNNLAIEDSFTAGDRILFQQTAHMGGLDPETFTQIVSPGDNDGTCNLQTLLEPESIASARALPKTYFCYSYLESQGATGEDGSLLYYWLALFIMLFVIRSMGLFLLRCKALY